MSSPSTRRHIRGEVGDEVRTKAELVAELEKLRKQVAALEEARTKELPRALDALRASQALYQRVTENASDLIAEVDGDGRFLFVSPNCEKVLGVPARSVVGLSIRDDALSNLLHPDDRGALFDAFLSAMRHKGEGEIVYRFRRADGAWRWFSSIGRTFRTPEGRWRAAVASRDVTDREEALRQLRQSEERYRVLVDSTHDLVAELDSEGRVVFMSPSCEQMLGFKPDELVGTTPFSLLHPGDVERLAERFLDRLHAERPPGHGQLLRARHSDGSWRWLQGGGVNFQTVDGETHVVAVARDVTDQIRAEEEQRRLEERVQQAQRFQSLAMLASGVAHDFNNLLTPILGAASLALMDLPPDSPARERLEKIQRASHHAAALTNQLLDYAGIGGLDPEPIDVSQLVLDMRELLASAVSKSAELRYELASGLPQVEAEPAQLSQLVINLVTNASDAIATTSAGTGRIRLASGCLELDRERLSRAYLGEDLIPATYVFLEVQDDGRGMDVETRGRIFDPFFTTKTSGRGLGLAAALGIVRKHGGAIEIESEPEIGTLVRVLLPPRRSAAARVEVAAPSERIRSDRGAVLVADDDEGARDLLTETLERAGLKVFAVGDGRQAVETFRAHIDEIRLVLLDRTMPVSTGEEALDAIRAISDVPVLLVSGYSEETSVPRFAGRSLSGFLQKPFLPETLIAKVRQILDD